MAFGWCGLASTSGGLPGLFSGVGIVVVLFGVRVTAFGGCCGGYVLGVLEEVAMGTMDVCAAVVEGIVAVWYPPREVRLERWVVFG